MLLCWYWNIVRAGGQSAFKQVCGRNYVSLSSFVGVTAVMWLVIPALSCEDLSLAERGREGNWERGTESEWKRERESKHTHTVNICKYSLEHKACIVSGSLLSGKGERNAFEQENATENRQRNVEIGKPSVPRLFQVRLHESAWFGSNLFSLL